MKPNSDDAVEHKAKNIVWSYGKAPIIVGPRKTFPFPLLKACGTTLQHGWHRKG